MNKKIFSLLIIAFGLIILPINAFARDVVKPETYAEKNINVWVLEESGLKLYADSSATTDNEIGVTIPYDGYATMKAQKYIDDGIWAYVEYENNEGWIFAVSNGKSNVAFENNREGLGVASNVNLYGYPSEESKIVGKATPNDLINVSYTYGDLSITWFYVDVNGTKGWIKGQDSFIEKQEMQIVLLNDASVYKEPDGKKTGSKVEKNKIITLSAIKYTVSTNKTLTYGLYNDSGKDEWILISGNNTNYASKIEEENFENEIATIVSGDQIYESATKESKVVGTIGDDTKITEAYKYKDSEGNDSYYIVSDAGNGWILKAFYSFTEKSSDEPVSPKKAKGFSTLSVCIFGVVLLAIAVGVILFVTKKQKKVDNTK